MDAFYTKLICIILGLINPGNAAYFYDRFSNRAIRDGAPFYLGDNNVFYLSSNFHSIEYCNKNNTFLKSKSLPILR